jgi:hypothetical protein
MERRWMAVVMGALLVGTLIGVVWVRPGQSAQAAGATHKLTIPAASFHPIDDGQDYVNNGVVVWTNSSDARFSAPVVFPCQYAVRVERIIFSAWDQNASGNACVSLWRVKPDKGTRKQMTWVCSSGSQTSVVNYTNNSVNPAVVLSSHGLYLFLDINGSSIDVYGVQIEYKKNT